jgi:hypothetical protein
MFVCSRRQPLSRPQRAVLQSHSRNHHLLTHRLVRLGRAPIALREAVDTPLAALVGAHQRVHHGAVVVQHAIKRDVERAPRRGDARVGQHARAAEVGRLDNGGAGLAAAPAPLLGLVHQPDEGGNVGAQHLLRLVAVARRWWRVVGRQRRLLSDDAERGARVEQRAQGLRVGRVDGGEEGGDEGLNRAGVRGRVELGHDAWSPGGLAVQRVVGVYQLFRNLLFNI